MRRPGYKEISDAIRREMAEGLYRAGEPLPSVNALRKRFGVGEWTVRAVLHELRDEGLLSIAKHVGAIATDKAAFAWKGHIVFAHPSVSGSYYIHRFACRLANRLESAGWMTHQVFLDPDCEDTVDTSPLARHVAGGLDFAVVASEYWQFTNLFDRAGVPYIVIGGGARDFPNARAIVKSDTSECFGNLIASMKAQNLESILEIDFERRMDRSFKLQLTAAGISVRRLMCIFDNGRDRYSLGDVTAGGRHVVAEFLANPKNRTHPPDVILFDDDYLAAGGVSAILEAGLRIPEDIRVVAHSNRGNELALVQSLARIESDPVANANLVADYVMAVLAGRRAAVPRPKTRFVPGGGL